MSRTLTDEILAVPHRRRISWTDGLVALSVVVALLATLAIAPSVAAAPAYPVKVGPTGRYLVDQNGVPFLITGDSPQAMVGNLSEADAELFFANRQGHGFNTVWIHLLCNSSGGCREDGRTFDGVAPFTVAGDLATPNEAYFARVDRILQLAARYGFLVMLDPAETAGWLGVLRNNGVAKCRAYGQFLGRRYAGFDNVLWLHGNDYQDHGPDNDQYTTAVALGIQDVDTRHLHTIELDFPVSGSLDDPRWAPIIQLNASYTYGPTYQQVLKDYNRPSFLPTFLVEASYEGEHDAVGAVTRLVLRRQEYWSLLSGAAGQLYGNTYIWQFLAGWKDQLDSPGAIQVSHVAELFRSRRWFDLVPDQAHTLVTGELTTFGGVDYVTAARTSDGTLGMAYTPSARTLTVDMSRMSGPVTARWWDPAGGRFVDIAPSSLPNTGFRNFTTPGSNSDGPGNEDWVLVLEVTVPTNVQFGALGDIPVPADYDGDRRADLAVYRPSTGQWLIQGSATGVQARAFGAPASSGLGDTPVPADYDGDRTTDLAIYRRATGEWFILNSAAGFRTVPFGAPAASGLGDTPVPADYDGDGKADVAIYRQATGEWLIFGSATGFRTLAFGAPAASGLGDIPVPADYDGDGKADVAIYRRATGEWFIFGSATGFRTLTFGAPAASGLGDIPVPADYDGDGAADVAIRRGTTGTWFVFRSTLGFLQQGWGAPTDAPVPADYAGTHRANIAVWSPSTGIWSALP
jgi:hypothetical protein